MDIGGTSVSSPLWAGYLSNIQAAFSYFNLGSIGYFNPLLYAVGTADFGVGTPDAFLNEIIQGQNGLIGSSTPGFFNGYGYSNTTVSGTIWGGLAAQLMIGLTQPGGPPGATYNFKVKTTGTTATFSWYPSQGAVGYAIGIYHYDILGNLAPMVYVTKAKKLTVTDLPPIPPELGNYYAFLWCFNSSGFYQVPNPVNFNTK